MMYSHVRFKYICYVLVINTTIKTTSICDGDAQCRGWLAGDIDGLAGDG